MNNSTQLTNVSSTEYSTSAAELHEAPAPSIVMRSRSSHTSTIGVFVEGSMRVQHGHGGALSLFIDPATLGRKLAVQQLQRELRGTPTSTTTNRFR
jgi:hypothetical protein